MTICKVVRSASQRWRRLARFVRRLPPATPWPIGRRPWLEDGLASRTRLSTKTVTSRPSGKAKKPTRGSGRRVGEASPPYVAGVCYVESSALLAALLEGDSAAMASLRSASTLLTSSLTFAECRRAIVRAQASGRVTTDEFASLNRAIATFASRCTVVSVTSEILARTGHPFPVEPVRTLDGIHLATIEALGEPPRNVTVLTRDARVRANAAALGFITD
jgi:PIN domain